MPHRVDGVGLSRRTLTLPRGEDGVTDRSPSSISAGCGNSSFFRRRMKAVPFQTCATTKTAPTSGSAHAGSAKSRSASVTPK
eukprot:6177055-Pleurochrysis_carterae.AAC.2